MNNREVILWIDAHWCDALESLAGETMDTLLQKQVDGLIQQLPQDVRERISYEIDQENERWQREVEANRRISLKRITENGQSHIYLTEHGEDMFQAAVHLRRYLRGEVPSYASKDTELTEDQAERYMEEAISGSPRVVSVFDIDLDKGEFASLDLSDGWHTFRTQDVSTAIYLATKNKSANWKTTQIRFYGKLSEKELPSSPRPAFTRKEQRDSSAPRRSPHEMRMEQTM
jgi:hypothetical protein